MRFELRAGDTVRFDYEHSSLSLNIEDGEFIYSDHGHDWTLDFSTKFIGCPSAAARVVVINYQPADGGEREEITMEVAIRHSKTVAERSLSNCQMHGTFDPVTASSRRIPAPRVLEGVKVGDVLACTSDAWGVWTFTVTEVMGTLAIAGAVVFQIHDGRQIDHPVGLSAARQATKEDKDEAQRRVRINRICNKMTRSKLEELSLWQLVRLEMRIQRMQA